DISQVILTIVPYTADLFHAADYADIEGMEQFFAQGTHSNPGCCFTCRGTFKHISQITHVILHAAYQVGMPRTWFCYDTSHGFRLFGREWITAHDLAPVFEVIVDNLNHYRAAKSFSMSDSAAKLESVFFNLHPPAASVASLTFNQFIGHSLFIDFQVRRKSFHYR